MFPSVRVFTFKLPFKQLFDPTSQSEMSQNLEIQNTWGKVMKRNGLRLEEKILIKGLKLSHKKKLFLGNCLPSLGEFASLPASLVKYCPNEQDFLYKCFNAYRSRDSLFPVCRIFFYLFFFLSMIQMI